MSAFHDNGKIQLKTEVVFSKLKRITKMFDGIDDFDEFVMKQKPNEEEASNENENTFENSSHSEQVMLHPPKMRRKIKTSDSDPSVATPSHPPRKLRKDKKHKNSLKKSKTSEIESPGDNVVYPVIKKINGESKLSFKTLDFKFPPSKTKKDVHAVAPDKRNFPTADPSQRWEQCQPGRTMEAS
ncbi:MAG: hypothetical protein EZS28_054278 [Streblomastix strix]|uniref:Uncharacterized protein n=1 Tax=Streblomastix strix TaxID=222440 RepID=A0A5J4QT29_9EUKA|nr:MAG: hypothetical protein EZS28_054278 [Streblomastix strix]